MVKDNNIETYEDEINLWQLFLIIKKRIILFTSITLLILALGILYTIISPPIYTVSNVLIVPQASTTENLYDLRVGNIINLIEIKSLLSNFNDKSALSQKKEIVSETDAKNIFKIKVKQIKDSNLLQIDVDTMVKESGKVFIDNLPKYIFSRDFVSKRVSDQKQLIKKNIQDLETFMNDPLLKLKIKKGNIIVDPLSFKNLYEQYNNYKVSLEWLDKGDFVTLSGKTYLPEKSSKSKKAIICILSLLTGIFLGIIIIFIVEGISNAKQKYKNLY
jgi:LPS O-antigen subunit length determinant protein (WzzB/FepE family)